MPVHRSLLFADSAQPLLVSLSRLYNPRALIQHRYRERLNLNRVKMADLVVHPVHLHPLCPLWVQIVAQHQTPLLGCRHGKRSDTGHDVRHDLAGGKGVDEPLVFGVQARVPVDGFEVEGEGAVGFVLPVSCTLVLEKVVRQYSPGGRTTVETKTSSLSSPAMTSMSKNRYSAWILASLLTTVRSVLFFCTIPSVLLLCRRIPNALVGTCDAPTG